MHYEITYLGSASIPGARPRPTPAPFPERLDITDIAVDPATGAGRFAVPSLAGVLPITRVLYLPSDFDEATPAEEVFNGDHPCVEFADLAPQAGTVIEFTPPETVVPFEDEPSAEVKVAIGRCWPL